MCVGGMNGKHGVISRGTAVRYRLGEAKCKQWPVL